MTHRLLKWSGLAAVVLIPVAASFVSCGISCTLIGCDGGLTVRIRGQLPTTYRVLAEVNGFRPLIVECTPQSCGNSAYFPDFFPAELEVTIETTTSSVTRRFKPEWRTFRPNGEGCEPECKVAVVEIDL
jgi:hypothetical protein